MTLDQIDQMVRKANPVPDLNVLEPVDASVLVLDQQRRTEMQTHNRVEVDQEAPQNPRRGVFIGIAAVAAIVVGVLVFLRPLDGAPVAADQPVEVATAFVEAYGTFDVEQAITYLAFDADVSGVIRSGGAVGVAGTLEEFRLFNSLMEADGYKQILNSCEELWNSASDTRLRCVFDFHLIRSDEIGLGPFSGSYFDLTVRDGKIVRASMYWGTGTFSQQMWDPFASWVSTAYPEDAAVMYEDETHSGGRLTEESIALWEQRSREYVAVARERIEAEQIAVDFIEAYAAFDVDTAASYLAADADLRDFGGEGEVEGIRRWNSLREAIGFKLMLDSCEESGSSPSGTGVRCTFDFHSLRSDEIGLRAFSGSWFDFTVLEGEIVFFSENLDIAEYTSQMWSPFADWVAEAYPADVVVMYEDSRQDAPLLTEESITLWEQRSREYVEVAAG